MVSTAMFGRVPSDGGMGFLFSKDWERTGWKNTGWTGKRQSGKDHVKELIFF